MKQHLLILGLIIAAGIIAYSNSTCGSFHFDDLSSIVQNQSIRHLNPGKIWTGNNHFRFVGFSSFALNFRISGIEDVRGWHYVNISLHILCALLLYWVLFFLIEGTYRQYSKIPCLPLMASILFVVHPLCSEPVNYIQARHVLFCSLFSLSGVLWTIFFIRSRSRLRKTIAILGIAASIILGGLSKEVGIFYVPAAIGAYFLAFGWRGTKALSIPLLVISSGAAAAIIAFIIVTNWVISLSMIFWQDYNPAIGEITFFTNLLTEAQVFWRYASLLIPLSSRLNVDHHVRAVRVDMPGEMLTAVISLLCIGFVLAAIFRKKERNPMLCFFALWAILGILPYMFIQRSAELMVEYKTYLSAMGFMGLGALCLEGTTRVITRRRKSLYWHMIFGIGFSILVIFCIKETRTRNMVWKTEFTLWNDAVHKSPQKARPYNNRGSASYHGGKYDRAISDYSHAISLDPSYAEAYDNRGSAYYHKGEYDNAIFDYSHAISLDPKYAEAFYNRGSIYSYKREYDNAISDYNQAISLDPDHVKAYYNRGSAYTSMGEYDKAIFDYSHTISLDPNYAEAYNNRGVTYSCKREYDRAISDYNHALEINPGYVKVYYNRAKVYFEKKDYDKAWKDVQKAQALGYKIDHKFLELLRRSSEKHHPTPISPR